MSEQKLKHNHFPYQVINGEVYELNQLHPSKFLVNKPLLPLLEYLTSEGLNIKKSTDWCKCAAKIGDLEALQWLRAGGAPWDTKVCSIAALNGHIEILRWARAGGAPWDDWVCLNAAYKGHLEILKWARAAGAPWDNQVCCNAARNGHLKVLIWGRSNRMPWNDYVCDYAASNGHLEVFQWLRAEGARWDEWTFHYAFHNNYPKIVRWAYENGCPCSDEDEQPLQQMMLARKDVNWSLQCKERWRKDNCELFCLMIDRVVNGCHKVTYDLLPTCLSKLVVNYL